MQKHFPLAVVLLLILAACKGSPTAEVIPAGDVRDIRDCIDAEGLVVQSEYLKCVTENGEFPLGRPTVDTMEEPGAEDWSGESFFTALTALDQSLDFTWDMDLPVMGEHGKSVVLKDEIVFFFRFASPEEAEAEIASLKETGKTTKGMGVYWGAEARYFRKGAVVAVYTGVNEDIAALLENAAS